MRHTTALLTTRPAPQETLAGGAAAVAAINKAMKRMVLNIARLCGSADWEVGVIQRSLELSTEIGHIFIPSNERKNRLKSASPNSGFNKFTTVHDIPSPVRAEGNAILSVGK